MSFLIQKLYWGVLTTGQYTPKRDKGDSNLFCPAVLTQSLEILGTFLTVSFVFVGKDFDFHLTCDSPKMLTDKKQIPQISFIYLLLFA